MRTAPATTGLDLDLANRLRSLLHVLRRVLPFESGGLFLYESEHKLLVPYAYLGDREPLRLGQGLEGQAAERRRLIQTTDGTCSHVAAPVMHEDTLYGVLSFENCHVDALSPEQLALIELQAAQLALEMDTIQQARALRLAYAERLAALDDELRQMRLLHTLANLGIVSYDDDPVGVLEAGLREAADLLGCDGAQLLLPDQVTYQLVVHQPSAVGRGASEPRAGWALDGHGCPVDAYHTGEPCATDSGESNGIVRYRNALACPLNAHKRTLGVLYLFNRRSGGFTVEHIALGQKIANQIAASAVSGHFLNVEVRRADLMNRINRVSQKLYATLDVQGLLRKIAFNVQEVFQHDAIYVLLLSEDGQTLRLRASATSAPELQLEPDFVLPMDASVSGRTIRTGRSQVVPDVREDPDFYELSQLRSLQSMLAVPLRRGEQKIGVIVIFATQLNAFSDLERDALETLATQFSIALENAHLYDQAQRRLLEQSIVHQIGRDLTSILDYGELAQAMVQHMNRALNTSSCIVGLYEPEHHAVRISADYRAPHHPDQVRPLITGKRLSLDGHPAHEQAIRTREHVVIYRSDPDAPEAARALLERLGDSSQLVLPMVTGDRVIGVVDWTDYLQGRRFSADDIRLAQTLVGQATIAFENALLFQELEIRARELAEANRLKNQFLATISHELRTPMNSIIGFSETLLNNLYGTLNDDQAGRIERIRRNGYDLLALIDDLLDLSKIDAGRMDLTLSSVNLGEMIAGVVQGLEAQVQAHGLTLDLDAPPDPLCVVADPQRLQQVLNNLLSNAIKFTHEGGISVTSRRVTVDGQTLVATEVADTGIGIVEADQAIIFDEFRQADGSTTRLYGGTGLGLAITRKLVEMMGGTIGVESAPGEGSRFTFTLPQASEPC